MHESQSLSAAKWQLWNDLLIWTVCVCLCIVIVFCVFVVITPAGFPIFLLIRISSSFLIVYLDDNLRWWTFGLHRPKRSAPAWLAGTKPTGRAWVENGVSSWHPAHEILTAGTLNYNDPFVLNERSMCLECHLGCQGPEKKHLGVLTLHNTKDGMGDRSEFVELCSKAGRQACEQGQYREAIRLLHLGPLGLGPDVMSWMWVDWSTVRGRQGGKVDLKR